MERVTTFQSFERILEIVKKENSIKDVPREHKANILATALKSNAEDILMCVRANLLPTRHIVHFCLDRGISIDKIVY
ncbi:MAG: hypothetical protein DRG78_24640 [Epsilonproteobacteria bacterium]|nr:MAG: hypothetical protein DRG78_24640 [Campylobacterota bacterium]